MSKKVLIQLGILIALIGVLIILVYTKKNKQRFETENATREFAIKDRNSISRIFMVDKAGKFADLKKQPNGSWTYNDTFDAWQSRVDFLIDETICKLAVKSPVPKTDLDNVLRRFTVAGVKVEIYTTGLNAGKKVYYVGGTTSDQLGTYFLMEGDKSPFVVHVQGFNGYLNSRYTLESDEWISRTIFSSKKEEIEQIKITYPTKPASSFSITQNGDDIDVEMEKGLPTNVSNGAVRSYLNLFELLNFEGYDDTKSKSFIDSLKGTTPLATISVRSKNRGFDELSFYLKPIGDRTGTMVDKDGNVLADDADRFYGIYNKLDRLLIVQDYTFGKVLVRYQDLLMRNK